MVQAMFENEQDATAWSLLNLYPACTDTAKRVATQVSLLTAGWLHPFCLVTGHVSRSLWCFSPAVTAQAMIAPQTDQCRPVHIWSSSA